jgi:hypothetical protein
MFYLFIYFIYLFIFFMDGGKNDWVTPFLGTVLHPAVYDRSPSLPPGSNRLLMSIVSLQPKLSRTKKLLFLAACGQAVSETAVRTAQRPIL